MSLLAKTMQSSGHCKMQLTVGMQALQFTASNRAVMLMRHVLVWLQTTSLFPAHQSQTAPAIRRLQQDLK